ncbi:hypothetical protein LSAT2_011265, partial [Lamellibrachia satsuma]
GEEIDAKEGFIRKLAGRRIKWAGHVEGMKNEQLMKRTDAFRGEGKMTRGKQRLIWDDGVKRYMSQYHNVPKVTSPRIHSHKAPWQSQSHSFLTVPQLDDSHKPTAS